MTLIVEDGSGKSDAESYVTVAEADAYIAKWALTNNHWPSPYSDTQKEVALRTAARFLDLEYRVRYVSRKAHETQALEWPRNGWVTRDMFIINNATVPDAVKEAQIELAVILSLGEVVLPVITGGGVIYEQNETEVTRKAVRYATPKHYDEAGNEIKEYPMIERILSPVLHRPGRLDRR